MRNQKMNLRKHILAGTWANGSNTSKSINKNNKLISHKKEAKEIAKQLEYNRVMPDVCERIDNAKTCMQVTNILTYCRKVS